MNIFNKKFYYSLTELGEDISISRQMASLMLKDNKIQKIYQGESADKRIYEDVLKTSVFTDNENRKLFINIHAKGIDLSNKKLIR